MYAQNHCHFSTFVLENHTFDIRKHKFDRDFAPNFQALIFWILQSRSSMNKIDVVFNFWHSKWLGNEGVPLAVWVHKMRYFLLLLCSLFFNLCDLQDDEVRANKRFGQG